MNKLPFGFDKPRDSPGFLLWQTTMIWQRKIKKLLTPHELSHAQFVIMATLLWFEAKHYETTQKMIVEWTKLDKMTVSQALKNLTKRMLIQRYEHEKDTRFKTVHLTAEGKKLTSTLIPQIEKIDALFFNENEKESVKLFNKIINDEKNNTN